MSEDVALQTRQKPHQYGEDIVEPGEPYTEATLVTIRELLAESDPVPQPRPIGESLPFAKARRKKPLESHITPPQEAARSRDADIEAMAFGDPAGEHIDTRHTGAYDAPQPQSWRKIEVVEGSAGRNLRRFLMSPRMVSVVFLCGVVAWQPWFIPMLALMCISAILLVGALIGQDRMARILLFGLKRFVWADPVLARRLQKILPRRWHKVLYRPVTEETPWDGHIDPSFEARLARIRS